MRFTLQFSLKHTKLPADIRHSVISYIKAALTKAQDGAYYASFFDNTMPKPYTWSVVLHEPKFSAEHILVSQDECKIRFSIMNGQGLEYILLNSLMAMRGIEFPLAFGNSMSLQNVQLEKEPKLKENHVLVRTELGGGICVRNHQRDTNRDRYLSVEDAGFNDVLTETVQHQLERFELPSEGISVTCVEGKKVIVRHFSGQMFPVTVGYVYLTGNPYVLQQLVAMGIGSRRSQGYGMVQIVSV